MRLIKFLGQMTGLIAKIMVKDAILGMGCLIYILCIVAGVVIGINLLMWMLVSLNLYS